MVNGMYCKCAMYEARTYGIVISYIEYTDFLQFIFTLNEVETLNYNLCHCESNAII